MIFLTSKCQDTRTEIKVYLSFMSCPFANQIQYMNEELHYSPHCWHLFHGPRLTDQGVFSQSSGVKKSFPSIFFSFFLRTFKGIIHRSRHGPQSLLFCTALDIWFVLLKQSPFHPHSLYLASFNLGIMFMDCSSWKSSLQAYGIRREDT